jgi:hypothetical protein
MRVRGRGLGVVFALPFVGAVMAAQAPAARPPAPAARPVAARKPLGSLAQVMRAILFPNSNKMVEAAGTVSEACENCHTVYREKPDRKDRCKP